MEDRLHLLFSNAASNLATYYKEIQSLNEKSYLQGRSEALEELIHWCEELQAQGLKYVPVLSFLELMQKYSSNIKIQEFPESRKRVRDN